MKDWDKFIRIYYNDVSDVRLLQKSNTGALLSMNTFKIPKQLDSWMNKIYNDSIRS